MYVKSTAIVFALAASFGLSACGNNHTTNEGTPSQSSSVSATPSAVPSNGVNVTLRQEGKRLGYEVEAPVGGVAQGKVTIKVGSWETTTESTSGFVTPLVVAGNYTANVVYTNLDGGTLTGNAPYVLPKNTHVTITPKRAQGPIGKPWEAQFVIEGNPLVTGTVTLTDDNGKQFAAGSVKEGVASIPMPVKDKEYSQYMTVKYSGDVSNGEAQKKFQIYYDSAYNG